MNENLIGNLYQFSSKISGCEFYLYVLGNAIRYNGIDTSLYTVYKIECQYLCNSDAGFYKNTVSLSDLESYDMKPVENRSVINDFKQKLIAVIEEDRETININLMNNLRRLQMYAKAEHTLQYL